jgi:hypothetical protein
MDSQDTSEEQGVYKKLHPELKEIRLMKLHPSLFSFTLLHYSLSNGTIPNPLAYRALSYVWGDQSDQTEIQVNGKALSVTKNLYAALKRLWQPNSGLLLWVDAICIDQTNVIERNQQVQLMKDVYSQAKETIVWLGESDRESDLAMDLIKAWAPPGAEGMAVARVLRGVPNAFDPQAWEAARHLFARPYWKRAWILQEVAFSKKVTILCGTKKLDWRDIDVAQISWVKLSQPENSALADFDELKMVTLSNYNVVSPISLLRLAQKPGFDRSSLDVLVLIETTHNAHSTDPKDKIYALLGFEEIRALGVKPDYKKPVDQVFAEFVQVYIQNSRNLNILGRSGIGWTRATPHLNLPSWVPDFRGISSQFRPKFRSACFSASKGREALAFLSDDFKTLSAQGLILDEITETHASRSEDMKAFKDEWLKMALQCGDVHPTGIPQLQAFFRTMITDDSGCYVYNLHGARHMHFVDEAKKIEFFNLAAGMMWWIDPHHQGPERLAEKFGDDIPIEICLFMARANDYLRSLALWGGNFSRSLSRQSVLAPFLGEPGSACYLEWGNDPDLEHGRKGSRLFAERVAFACSSRAFFVSRKGYIGLAPEFTMRGDLVCVFCGCDKPLIIRKIDNHYALVGDSYIYGLMDGEALLEAANRNLSFQELALI